MEKPTGQSEKNTLTTSIFSFHYLQGLKKLVGVRHNRHSSLFFYELLEKKTNKDDEYEEDLVDEKPMVPPSWGRIRGKNP